MQLKSIKAYGFKSFADKIEIEIKDGITGIVGPNGSGKSNIVDAVKWVLGEQSVKALRGSTTMSDVIFQGSSSRRPLTRASVSLVLDNKDHYLNSEYDEIEIKRTVYNSGENEYSINNAKVRLKDITDLFLDSGAGKEAFSIISQGKIGEILNSRPEERRSIIEEAAGVLKYKKRKIESLRKLEKTKDNLSKIDLIINELEISLQPLKIDAEKAQKYRSFKEELESIEISLLVNDITTLNKEYEVLKKEADTLRGEIENLEASNTKGDATSEKLKLALIKLERDINEKSAELLSITENISGLEASKQVIVERKKYEVDDVKLASNCILLKENILELKNNLSAVNIDIENSEKKIETLKNKKAELENDSKKYSLSRSTIMSELDFKHRLHNETKNKIDIITSNIENDNILPYSVKSILNNPRLKGICGSIGNLIEMSPQYSNAIDTLLGASQNFIVTETENDAKKAIEYLKENKLGRATFFPMNVIKSKSIDESTMGKIKSAKGFIDIAANLVTYDTKYKDIIDNQLGNCIVVENMDDMNSIGKLIDYKYRIATLDGEILHTGGSLTGGTKNNNKNIISEKTALQNLNNELERITKDIDINSQKLEEINKNLELCNDALLEVSNNIIAEEEIINNKISTRTSLNTNIKAQEEELAGTENIKSGSLDKELEETLEVYYKELEHKNIISSQLDALKSKKSDLNEELNAIEFENRKFNANYNKKVSDLKDLEIKLGKLDIKLDNLLLRLNDEYNITYERAKFTYEIRENISEDRDRVQTLRRNIRELGEVNLGAISEFERINTRYEFLSSQKSDLNASIEDLLSIISEMDETMKAEFASTFDKVNEEFKKVFVKLFKGGHGELVLTDKDNMLETGIDIIAEPPGKKLKNITLLSGGEKTLTAIALLFAILNVKVVPFCILDEVEAALDEANVDTFGTYLKEYEHKTQFIVITHKKKTMEYANTLYGITMQESGVSKLVSVRLEGIEK